MAGVNEPPGGHFRGFRWENNVIAPYQTPSGLAVRVPYLSLQIKDEPILFILGREVINPKFYASINPHDLQFDTLRK